MLLDKLILDYFCLLDDKIMSPAEKQVAPKAVKASSRVTKHVIATKRVLRNKVSFATILWLAFIPTL